MDDHQLLFQEKLDRILNTNDPLEIENFIETNIAIIFSTPDIPKSYSLIKDSKVQLNGTLCKIIIAWMALVSGDHGNLFLILNSIVETDLSSPEESSLFYGLKALSEYIMDGREGLRYAKLSLDVLPKGDKSLYMANAKLTYGQLLSANHEYRKAAEMFEVSAQIFIKQDLFFLSVVALTNEFLNRYKLGDFKYVVDKCQQTLIMSGSYINPRKEYWNIINLPLGICYYELNKLHLAIDHLKKAKESIDRFELFHLHGFIELYLFKSYFYLRDYTSMENITNDTISRFHHMNFRQIDLIVSMFKIFSSVFSTKASIDSEIEMFEMEFIKEANDKYNLVFDVLIFLKLNKLSETISIEDLEKRLDKLKYIGYIPQIQLTLVHLAELCYLEGKETNCINYLREGIKLYKEYGLCSSFCFLSTKTVGLISEIDKKLYLNLKKNTPNVANSGIVNMLSQREKEVLSLIAQGKSNEEIGKELFITIGTIKWHVNNIFGKLQVKNRVQAIEKAKALREIF